jgi:phospholipid/cholesterol/gamma-HCH transport system permease protein
VTTPTNDQNGQSAGEHSPEKRAAPEAKATPDDAAEQTGPGPGTALLVPTFGYLGEMVILLGQTLRGLARGVHAGDMVRQMSVIGVQTVPIALLTIAFTGAVLALYTVETLVEYGANDLVGGVVALSILREIGPILSGVVVAARAGSAMTAEIGSMKVTEQIDALRAMGISPVDYLIVPRVVAGILVVPMLTLFANLGGIFGGGMTAASLGVGWTTYISSIRQLMNPDGSDITRGLLKAAVFAVLIVLVGCREGMATEGGAVGVGNSTTRSVVLSIILIFVANFFLSYLMFHGKGG